MANKEPVLNDSFSVNINFKWLLQIIGATAILVYSFWKIEGRIQSLERDMVLAMEKIELHDQERKDAEKKHINEIQEQLDWYETELNLNPFSWGKNKKKKLGVIMVEWMVSHWEWLLIAFMVAEKCVKASKTIADDILLDIVWKNIKGLVKK